MACCLFVTNCNNYSKRKKKMLSKVIVSLPHCVESNSDLVEERI